MEDQRNTSQEKDKDIEITKRDNSVSVEIKNLSKVVLILSIIAVSLKIFLGILLLWLENGNFFRVFYTIDFLCATVAGVGAFYFFANSKDKIHIISIILCLATFII